MNGEQDKRHGAPGSNKDYDFFYEGLGQGKLLIQQCKDCGEYCHPPAPMCPHCNSVEKIAREMSGRGNIYSYIVHYYPPILGFTLPHPVGLIELEEGVRVVGVLENIAIEQIEIDMPVTAVFSRRGDMATLNFVPAVKTEADR